MKSLFITLLFTSAIFGFQASATANPVADTQDISLAELEQKTSHLPYISYVGTDGDYQYFRADRLGYFRVPMSQSPSNLPKQQLNPYVAIGDTELFVRIVDGEIAPPHFDGSTIESDSGMSTQNIVMTIALFAIAGFIVWSIMQPRYQLKIVIDADGVTQHEGLPNARQGSVTRFLNEHVKVKDKLIIYATRQPNGRLQLRFSGPIDAGTQQRIRNFFVEVL